MQFKNKKAILFHHDLEVKIIFFFNILIKKENQRTIQNKQILIIVEKIIIYTKRRKEENGKFYKNTKFQLELYLSTTNS